MKSLLGLLVFGGLSVALTAAAPQSAKPAASAPPASPTSAQAPATAPAETRTDQYQVGPTDTVAIVVDPDPVLTQKISGTYTVQANGTINVPQLPDPVNVSGLTTAQIVAKIRDLLESKQILTDPQVTATVASYRSQTFTVNGYVTTPGEYSLTGEEMTLIRAINEAGNRRADAGDTIEVRHALKPGMGPDLNPDDPNVETKTYKWADLQRGQDPRIHDGDYIYVPRAQTFLVNGEVKSPGAQVWTAGMNVAKALTLAGGMTDKGLLSRSYIDRRDPATKKYVRIDHLKLETPIQPDDSLQILHTWW